MFVDTLARRTARTLKSPTNAAFDLMAWRGLLDGPEKNVSDAQLVLSAIWIATQIQSLRTLRPAVDHARLGGALSTMLAVAALNSQVLGADARREKSLRRAARRDPRALVAMDELHARPVNFPRTGQELSSTDLLDAAGDSIEGWIFDAARAAAAGSGAMDRDALPVAAARGMQMYSIQHGINDLWQQALWEGWHLHADQKGLRWSPRDVGLALRCHAWQTRSRSNAFDPVQLELVRWQNASKEVRRALDLPNAVVSIERRPNQRPKAIVGRPAVRKEASLFVLAKAMLNGSYLSEFLERPLPSHPQLNCSLILKAWCVLASLADNILKGLAPSDLTSRKDVQNWACTVPTDEIEATLSKALDCEAALAAALASFLTWEPNAYKGIWGAPLVRVPGRGELCLAHPILNGANMIRSAEIWLQRGGLTDNLSAQSRGGSYESNLRSELRDAVIANALFDDAQVAENAIKKGKDSPEEIDLMIRIGSLLIVGEVKCFLFPADPRERHNYLRNVGKAASQSKRKAEVIHNNRDIVCRILSISKAQADSLRIVPLVILNQGFGMALQIEGVSVTDARFLKLYLGSGSFTSSALIDKKGNFVPKSEILYDTQAAAVEGFEKTIADPPPLRRFIERIIPRTFPFPTASGEPLICDTFVLGDIPDAVRQRAEFEALVSGMMD